MKINSMFEILVDCAQDRITEKLKERIIEDSRDENYCQYHYWLHCCPSWMHIFSRNALTKTNSEDNPKEQGNKDIFYLGHIFINDRTAENEDILYSEFGTVPEDFVGNIRDAAREMVKYILNSMAD